MAKVKVSEDFFEKVPEFLVAFERVAKEGFFEEVNFCGGSMQSRGKILDLVLSASGCIPNNKKYDAKGCGAIIDPQAIIASCRELARRGTLKTVLTEVKTEDWPKWDRKEENIIGSKGQRVKMSLTVLFRK